MESIFATIEKNLTEKIDKKLAEQKEEFDRKFAEHREEFDIKLEILQSVVDSLVDSRLKCWNSGVASSRGSSTPSIRNMRQAYVNKIAFCMCCGRPNTSSEYE
jgi:hypothetical protein